MANIFSGSEVVEMGIEIEKNGFAFYGALADSLKSQKVKEMFRWLAGEEEKHINAFNGILSNVKAYEPKEAYNEEYFAYIKALSDEYVFTKKKKGIEAAKSIKTELEAIELAIGFEKDSILFYHEMKNVVLDSEYSTIDKLIDQERSHLRKLVELEDSMEGLCQ